MKFGSVNLTQKHYDFEMICISIVYSKETELNQKILLMVCIYTSLVFHIEMLPKALNRFVRKKSCFHMEMGLTL